TCLSETSCDTCLCLNGKCQPRSVEVTLDAPIQLIYDWLDIVKLSGFSCLSSIQACTPAKLHVMYVDFISSLGRDHRATRGVTGSPSHIWRQRGRGHSTIIYYAADTALGATSLRGKYRNPRTLHRGPLSLAPAPRGHCLRAFPPSPPLRYPPPLCLFD